MELGAPTVLVNNAGNMLNNPLFRMSVDEWDQVVAVHLRGAFLMTRAVHGFMTEAGWGRIVKHFEHLGPGQPRAGELCHG